MSVIDKQKRRDELLAKMRQRVLTPAEVNELVMILRAEQKDAEENKDLLKLIGILAILYFFSKD